MTEGGLGDVHAMRWEDLEANMASGLARNLIQIWEAKVARTLAEGGLECGRKRRLGGISESTKYFQGIWEAKMAELCPAKKVRIRYRNEASGRWKL